MDGHTSSTGRQGWTTPRRIGRSSLAATCALLLGSTLASGCARSSHPPCAASAPEASLAIAAPGRVVFVLSTASEQVLANGKRRETGFFLNEFYEPYRALVDAGYTVAFATPEGRAPVIDPESLRPDYWKEHPQWLSEARAVVQTEPGLRNPMRLDELPEHSDEFQGIVVPGGQGVMIDLLDNEDLHAALAHFGASGRAVGLACHAPAILARMPEASNPFTGRRVTSVSGFEEFYIERFIMKGRAIDRGIGKQLAARGFDHDTGAPGKPFAVRDCTLATSQNPFSGDAFNTELIAALDVARTGGHCDCPG